MVFTTIVFSFGDDWFSSLPGKTGKGSLWRPFWQDSHGGSTEMHGDVTPVGRVAKWWSCLSWQSGRMVKLPENRMAWGEVAPVGSSQLGAM